MLGYMGILFKLQNAYELRKEVRPRRAALSTSSPDAASSRTISQRSGRMRQRGQRRYSQSEELQMQNIQLKQRTNYTGELDAADHGSAAAQEKLEAAGLPVLPRLISTEPGINTSHSMASPCNVHRMCGRQDTAPRLSPQYDTLLCQAKTHDLLYDGRR